MSALARDYLLLAWVIGAILFSGIALCHALMCFRGIELFGYGAAIGVVIHGFLGLTMGAFPQLRVAIAGLFLFLPIASVVYLWRRAVWYELFKRLSRKMRWALSLWLLFLVLCVAIVHLNVIFPATLADGRYVFKRHTVNVKIQYMTSLPCDNYIPFIVTEYLLRNISFSRERPLVPGNEVSNRTILMSLVAVPFRAVLGVAKTPETLGRFQYVGTDWPDVDRLNKHRYFDEFLIVGIFLNSLLLVGLLVFFSKLRARILVAGALLYITNPYFISQTIFTWPKALAGFFILLSWNSLRRHHDPKLVALWAALAYHSHPYGLSFAAALAVWYAWKWLHQTESLKSVVSFVLVFLLSIIPWLVWTRLHLGISSDLIAQNFSGAGTEAAHASVLDFCWVRMKNIFDLLAPRFFGVYPFDAAAVFDFYVTCLPGAVGPIMAVPSFFMLAHSSLELRWQMIVPATAIVLVFSYPCVPVVHNPPVVGALIFLGVAWLGPKSVKAFSALVGGQLLCNLTLIALQGYAIGAHLTF